MAEELEKIARMGQELAQLNEQRRKLELQLEIKRNKIRAALRESARDYVNGRKDYDN